MEEIIRDTILSLRKLLGEGQLFETKTLLGWLVDTRRFIISLDQDKFLRWNQEIEKLFNPTTPVSSETLESLLGKINHVGFIILLIRYILTDLRSF